MLPTTDSFRRFTADLSHADAEAFRQFALLHKPACDFTDACLVSALRMAWTLKIRPDLPMYPQSVTAPALSPAPSDNGSVFVRKNLPDENNAPFFAQARTHSSG